MNTSNPSGNMKKSFFTPCRRIGLSKTKKTTKFKSPLIQNEIVLKYDSPITSNTVKELDTSLATSTPIAAETKRKSDVQHESKTKRMKHDVEPKKKVKKRLINNDSDSETEKVNTLDVSGCDLLRLDEKTEENTNDTLKTKQPLIKKETNFAMSKKLYVSLEKLPDNVENTKNQTPNECLRKEKNESTKRNSDQIKEVLKEKNEIAPLAFSPKTIVSELATKPLINNLDGSPHFQVKNPKKLKSKNSIDDYIKKKEKQKALSNSSSSRKLSLKKSTATSDSFESDDDFLEKPNSQKSNPPNVDKFEIIEKIIHLESTINGKVGQLERYKQAEIYHKLHDVQKLESLTKTWKSGCEDALRDLLLKLKEHANIDMQGLLKKLGAPDNLIKYNAENGVFV